MKDRGIWQSFTWKDCYEKVKFLSMGLLSLGLEKEDKVSILGGNKPEWYWAELATQAVGGAAVGIFVDCIPTEIKFYLEHSESKFVFAHDQEQVDKILKIKDQLPLLKKAIYWESKGLWNYRDSILMSFDELLESGGHTKRTILGFLRRNSMRERVRIFLSFAIPQGLQAFPREP